jgi:hypothetical protein
MRRNLNNLDDPICNIFIQLWGNKFGDLDIDLQAWRDETNIDLQSSKEENDDKPKKRINNWTPFTSDKKQDVATSTCNILNHI